MKQKKIKHEVVTVSEKINYIPFVNNEKIVNISFKDEVDYKLTVVEKFTEITKGKTESKNESVNLNYLKTLCLVIETDIATEIEILIIK